MNLVGKKQDKRSKEDAERFGIRLRTLRKRAGLTQAALADKLGLDYQAVSRLERGGGVPNWSTVKRIAVAVAATPNDFLSEEEWHAADLDAEEFIPDALDEDEE